MLSANELKVWKRFIIDWQPYEVVSYAQKVMWRWGSIINIKAKNLITWSNIPKTLSDKDQFEVTQILANIDCFDFNIFELDKILQNRILYYLANSIFISMEIDYLLQSDKWISFITAIIKGYGRDTIRYHNDIHAANVFQTSYALLKKGDLKNKLKLTDLDVFSFLLATICHDFKHTGFSNNYLINLKHSIAITYNGKILY